MMRTALVGLILLGLLLTGCAGGGATATVQSEAAPEAMTATPRPEATSEPTVSVEERESEGPGYVDVTPEEAKRLIEASPDVVIINVGAHPTGVIPGTVVLPVEGALSDAAAGFDPEGTYLVYGQYDVASEEGARKLVDAGLRNVYRLEGNFAAWKAAGYEVEPWLPSFATPTPQVEAAKREGYVDVSPEEAKQLIEDNPDLVILDVSSAYASGHIPGAINHYVGDGSLDAAIPTLDPDATYLVYCHFESASRLGAQKLIDAGFEKVYRLEGEFGAWEEAGYPVES